jgi:hypothetical protein
MIKYDKLPADILSRLPEMQRFLLSEEPVTFAYLFGGLAKGRLNPLTDIDIAVYVNRTNNLAEYKLHLFDRLTEILRTGELDLVILNTAPISLAGRILQKKKILVDKEPFRRHLYESATLRKFFDFQIKERDFFKRRYGIGG